LVLDDLSEDETAQVAQEIGQGYPGFRLLRGKPPPKGWVGKNWACWQLAQEARGEILVFTDADVFWEEGALGGLISALEGKDLVSALTRQEGDTAGMLVFLMNGLFSFLPHPALEALRFANGQVLAFRRDTVLEDIAIARRVKNYGLYLGLNVQELFGDDSGSWKELFGYTHEKPGHPFERRLLPPVPLHHTMAIRSLGSWASWDP
jgi:glycosyltransferase involved in cell wall biosynthesis